MVIDAFLPNFFPADIWLSVFGGLHFG